jgi:Mn-containing catalase
MFFHRQQMQHTASPDKPDAVYARKLQEVLGGQYGEITVAMQYGFQAWNAHIPGKYRDLLYGIGAEEFGHVEMLAVMIGQLLEKAPLGITTEAVQDDPTVAAVVGGTDVQAAIVAGAGSRPVDSNGNPWQGSYVTASGNLLADFMSNANAEMQGRLQVARLYHMTDDAGVRDLLAFLLARDTMHQNQWLAAVAELREEGVEDVPVPSNFPQQKEDQDVHYQYINSSPTARPPRREAGRAVPLPTERESSPISTAPRAACPCRRPRIRMLVSTALRRCRTSSRRRPEPCRTSSTRSDRRPAGPICPHARGQVRPDQQGTTEVRLQIRKKS